MTDASLRKRKPLETDTRARKTPREDEGRGQGDAAGSQETSKISSGPQKPRWGEGQTLPPRPRKGPALLARLLSRQNGEMVNVCCLTHSAGGPAALQTHRLQRLGLAPRLRSYLEEETTNSR